MADKIWGASSRPARLLSFTSAKRSSRITRSGEPPEDPPDGPFAFDLWEGMYKPRLLKAIGHRVRRDDREDLAQEVAKVALGPHGRAILENKSHSQRLAYLCGIAKHIAARWHRKGRITVELAEHHAISTARPDDRLDNEELNDRLERALRDLCPKYRQVILAKRKGMSMNEIAATLGRRISTVRSQLYRGKAELRQLLRGDSK